MSLNSRLLKLKGRICPHHPEHDSSLSLFAGCDNYQVIHYKWLATHVQEKRICSLLRTIIAVGKDCGESGEKREEEVKKIFCNNIPQNKRKTEKNMILSEVQWGRGPQPVWCGPAGARLGRAEQYQQRNTECGRCDAFWGQILDPGDIYYLWSIINIMMNLGELFVSSLEWSSFLLLNDARNPVDDFLLWCYEYVYENRWYYGERKFHKK